MTVLVALLANESGAIRRLRRARERAVHRRRRVSVGALLSQAVAATTTAANSTIPRR